MSEKKDQKGLIPLHRETLNFAPPSSAKRHEAACKWFDELSLRYLAVDDQRELIRHTAALAYALAGTDYHRALKDSTASMVAVLRATLAVYEQQYNEAVLMRDDTHAARLQKALWHATQRYIHMSRMLLGIGRRPRTVEVMDGIVSVDP